jgi:hypothetical protein
MAYCQPCYNAYRRKRYRDEAAAQGKEVIGMDEKEAGLSWDPTAALSSMANKDAIRERERLDEGRYLAKDLRENPDVHTSWTDHQREVYSEYVLHEEELTARLAKDEPGLEKVDFEDWVAQRSGARVLGVPVAEPATPTVPTEEYVGGEYQPLRLGPPPESGPDDLAAVQRGRVLDWSKKDEWSSQDQVDYDAYEAWENRRLEEKYGRSDD